MQITSIDIYCLQNKTESKIYLLTNNSLKSNNNSLLVNINIYNYRDMIYITMFPPTEK